MEIARNKDIHNTWLSITQCTIFRVGRNIVRANEMIPEPVKWWVYETDEIQSVLTNVTDDDDDDIAIAYNFKKRRNGTGCWVLFLLNNKQDLQRAQYPVTQVWRPFLPVRPNGVACDDLSALPVHIWIQTEVQAGLGTVAVRSVPEPRGSRYLLALLPPT